MENAWVAGISGVVTRVVVSQDSKGSNSETKFWIQAPQGDGDITTADALSVILKDSKSAPEIAIGDQVSVSGRVAETGRSGSLTLTQIVAATVAVVATDQALPAPIVLGHEGYSVPTDHVDDDGLSSFQPTSDAIDFFESIEGMRVALQDPVVVGATSRFGDFTIVTDRGVDSGPRTSRGGVLIGAEDLNPERIQVSPSRTATPSHLDVGDQFLGPITGVLGYAFGSFRVMVTERLPPVQPSTPSKKSPTPATCPTGSNGSMTSDTSGAFTVATFNVENLGGQSDVEKFERLAQIVVLDLGSPDLIALQEIQDNSGPEDDGTVAADQTFERLIKAISEVGGPSYSYVQIDPADGREGGQPGGNIRVGYLFDPHRVRFSRSLQTESRTAATLELGNIGLALAANPALLGILEPAFNEDLDAGLRPSRKPLVAEFWVGPHQIFVINVHLKSKRGDQPLFGNTQPPQRASELQRTLQARVIADFVARLLDQDPNANVIVLGDFNEHEFRSTVEPLRRVGLENLIERVPAPERYTHVYKGNSQVLDQVFVSRHLLETGRPEIQILHVNADFSAQTRSSDHDPILVRLELDARLEFAQ